MQGSALPFPSVISPPSVGPPHLHSLAVCHHKHDWEAVLGEICVDHIFNLFATHAVFNIRARVSPAPCRLPLQSAKGKVRSLEFCLQPCEPLGVTAFCSARLHWEVFGPIPKPPRTNECLPTLSPDDVPFQVLIDYSTRRSRFSNDHPEVGPLLPSTHLEKLHTTYFLPKRPQLLSPVSRRHLLNSTPAPLSLRHSSRRAPGQSVATTPPSVFATL